MVKINESSGSENKDENQEEKKEMPKLISCIELERRDVPIKLKLNSEDISLKKLDPAVLDFHSRKDILTRYENQELIKLKETKCSQSPPACLYAPHLMRLGILKYEVKDHPKKYEEQCESFRKKLSNLTMNNWDPNFLKLINNFNETNLGLGQGNSSPINMSRSGQLRHVSWKEEEKIPPYTKSAFFDNITTTTAFYRSRQSSDRNPRFNNNNNTFFNQNRNYPSNNNINRKHLNPLFQESTGLPEEDKKNLEDSLGKSGNSRDSRFSGDSREGDDELVDEPEWFSAPVSRLDTIELRGFDDDSPEKSKKKEEEDKVPKEKEFSFDNFMTTQHNGPKPNDRQAFFPNNARPKDCFDPYFGQKSFGFPQDNIRAPANSSNSSSASSPKHSQQAALLNMLHGQQRDFNLNEDNIYRMLTSLKQQQEMQQMQHRPVHHDQFMDRMNEQQNMHIPGMPGGPGQGFHYQNQQQGGYSAIWDKFRQEHNVPAPIQNGFTNFRNQRNYGGRDFHNQPQYHHNNMMPTPEQLMMHTQSIMQNALMRKANQSHQNNQNNIEKRFPKF